MVIRQNCKFLVLWNIFIPNLRKSSRTKIRDNKVGGLRMHRCGCTHATSLRAWRQITVPTIYMQISDGISCSLVCGSIFICSYFTLIFHYHSQNIKIEIETSMKQLQLVFSELPQILSKLQNFSHRFIQVVQFFSSHVYDVSTCLNELGMPCSCLLTSKENRKKHFLKNV